MFNQINDWLFSRFIKNRQIVGTKAYTLPNGERVDYVEFTGDSKGMAAQYIYGHIIASDHVFKIYSKDTQDVVISHELGHKKMPAYLAIPLTIIAVLGAVLLIFFISGGIGLSVVYFLSPQFNIVGLLVLGFGIAFWVMILLFASMGASWILETYAELYAINVVGMPAYQRHLKEREEKKNIVKKSTLERIRGKLSYPPDFLMLWIYRSLCKEKRN